MRTWREVGRVNRRVWNWCVDQSRWKEAELSGRIAVSSRYAEEAFETRIRHQRDQIERNQSILHKLFISRPGGFSFAGEDLHIPLSD